MTWPRPTNLQRIAASALAGEPEAWPRLVRRFERLLRDIGRQYRLAPADVDDAMQTTWLQLFRRLGTIRSARCAARLARRRRCGGSACGHCSADDARCCVGDEPIAPSRSRAPDALGDCSSAERREALREALVTLPNATAT